MRIAITDLKDYNEATLRFEWLDLEECSSKEDISEYIKNFLGKRSKETGELHEEWFVTDYDEFVNLGEYPNLDLMEKAISLSQEYGWEVVSGYYGHHNSLDDLEDSFNGIYESEEDFAYELANDIYSQEQLGALSNYIDWERFSRELFMTDYMSERLSDYKIAVFRVT